MSQISVRSLTFGYDGSYTTLFDNVSFSFDTGWKLGFVGRNGRGKTTLLKLMMGELAYSGSISSPVPFEYFPFPVPDPARPAKDVLFSIAPDAYEWQLARECNALALPEELLVRPFSTLSGGERTKALLAALFVKEERFLLIDEPTDHLDLSGRETVASYLRSKSGFLLVSHDRAFLDGCVDHILALNKTGLQVVKGNFTSWYENKQLQDAFERDENEKLQGEIRRLADSAQRTAGWSDRVEATKIGQHAGDRGAIGHKAAKMMKRAKGIENRREAAIGEKEKLLRDIEYASPLSMRPLVHHADVLVEAKELSVRYGEREVFKNLSFSVARGQRVALTGRNGSGKSSVLKLLAGGAIPYGGTLRTASGLVISYVPQDTSGLAGGLAAFAKSAGVDQSLFMTVLRKLDFPRAQFEKDMREYSAGQRKKALLARSLCERAHLYVWDEPLNYIDVLSRVQIEELIVSCAPAMLFVEHDRAFIDAVATDIVELG